jgi:HK97 family phage prohead protease
MTIKLHPKIQELKRKAAPINFNAVSVNQYGALENTTDLLNQHIVQGYAVIWGQKNLYDEIFVRGAFANSLNQRGPQSNSNYKIKFLYQHNQQDPLSLFDVLEENETGLFFKTKPLDEVPNAERTVAQIRSGTLNNFSIGWDYIWDKIEYDEAQDALIVKEANLFEISVVTIPADMSTFAYRSVEQLDTLHDDTEYFIKSLPRNFQLEARNIFARHKALINIEPSESEAQDETTLGNEDKPPIETRCKIDYNYLTKNFTL